MRNVQVDNSYQISHTTRNARHLLAEFYQWWDELNTVLIVALWPNEALRCSIKRSPSVFHCSSYKHWPIFVISGTPYTVVTYSTSVSSLSTSHAEDGRMGSRKGNERRGGKWWRATLLLLSQPKSAKIANVATFATALEQKFWLKLSWTVYKRYRVNDGCDVTREWMG